MGKKVLVAMSGGVDSSVAALLLWKQGFDLTGVTMYWGIETGANGHFRCCSQEAIEDARKVCRVLGIPHDVLDFSQDFEKLVIGDFVEQYRRGKTPNPCVVCNRFLKFGKLFRYAQNAGFDFLATGHYARITEREGMYFLQRPRDCRKDQTYFLYAIERERLPFILFPLAELTKEEVRKIALQAGLPVADKPQSQDICFLPRGDYRKFLAEKIGEDLSGPIVTSKGKVLGKHQGYFRYTIGQRKGLKVSDVRPLYVVAIYPKTKAVVVGEREDLKAKGLFASCCNFLVDVLPTRLCAQVRYLQPERPCSVTILDPQRVRVVFEDEVEMVTPGQSVVFYSNDTVLGGGIIDEVFR